MTLRHLLPTAFITAFIAAQAVLPCFAAQSQPQQPAFYTLANGMSLIVQPDHRAATAVQMLWVKAGSSDEVIGISGVAHALEHMMFKGTPTVPVGEFSKRIAAMGGEDNAFTSYDYTAFYQRVPAARLKDAMQLEADLFAHTVFRAEDFKKEIEVIKEERRMRIDDNPHAAMNEMMNAVTYSASPYRRAVIGWMDDLQHMQVGDVQHFYQKWYTPSNAAVVVVGDVDPAQVKAWADSYYGSIPAQASTPRPAPRAEPPQLGERRMEYKAVANRPFVALAFKIPSLGEHGLSPQASAPIVTDIYALTMLAQVLDGYEGARLSRALTQGAHRVADSVGADTDLLGRGPRTFVLQGSPAAGVSPGTLEKALRAQITRIAQNGVSPAELQRVKNQYAAGEVFKLDSLMAQAQEIGAYWALGLPVDTAAIVQRRLDAVTPAQVQSVAQRYFGDDDLTVGTLIPQKGKGGDKPDESAGDWGMQR